MTTEQMKKMIESIVKEAAGKLKADFNALPEDMDAMEALSQVVSAYMGDETVERLVRVAKQYGIPDLGSIGFRAHLKKISTPVGDSKDIVLTVEAENSHENRMLLAGIGGEQVNIYASQLELKEEAEDDGQEELDLGEDA